MSENGKPLRDRFYIKSIFSALFGQSAAGRLDKVDDFVLQELYAFLMEKLGKSKDDVVTILGREIGHALAAVIKEPLDQLLSGKQLRITFELVSRPGDPAPAKEEEPLIVPASSPVPQDMQEPPPKPRTAAGKKRTPPKKTVNDKM